MPDRSFTATAEDAYVECALWTEESRLDEEATEIGVDVLGLGPEANDELRAAMRAFLDDEDVAALVAQLDPAQVGHDFWLTRNRHGAGFWDRGLGEVGRKLTDAAHAYGDAYLYLGDNGYIEHG